MTFSEPSSDNIGGQDSRFRTTHWTMVLTASESSPQADEALAKLCQTYWYPLYLFIRRQGHSPEDAQDLVQSFLAQLVQKRFFKNADREKGKFRSFLLITLKRFMANEWDRANRLKRGGGLQIVSLDGEETENRYLATAADEMSPERAFERQWALTLLEQVFKKLKDDFAKAGKAEIFDGLKASLSGERREMSYAEIGRQLSMTEGSVKVSVHRLRQRYRELLWLEIANTVDSPQAVDEEIRHLFAALS